MVVNNQLNIKWPTILIIDSGVGGLSIYESVKHSLPYAYYIYVFDNQAFPYGEKTERFIIHRVISIIRKIWKLKKIDIIIIACNTASTILLPILRERFSCHIIGVVPAIKLATKLTCNGIIGLLATRATIQRSYTKNLIKQFGKNYLILKLGTAKLVRIAEAKLRGEPISLSSISKLIHPWLIERDPPDTIVLGCTHFSLLSEELKTILPKNTRLVDSSIAIANHVFWIKENKIDQKNLKGETGPDRIYCLSFTPQAISLKPILLNRYGFDALRKLKI